MSRRNGKTSSAISVNQHCVKVSVPELGFGTAVDQMIQFCWARREELHTGCIKGQTDCIYFCFRDRRNAEEFAERFGGESLVLTVVSGCFSA